VTNWVMLTGEYPPQPGGVSDYSWLLARRLAEAGDRVRVYAPPRPGPPPPAEGVELHRLPDCYGPASRAQIDRDLRRAPRPDRLVVQYVPQMYGRKGMNVPFALWLAARRAPRPDVIFHEFALYPEWFPTVRQTARRAFGAVVTHAMAGLIARAARRVYISTPAWKSSLRVVAPGCRPIWLPMPSNIAEVVDPEAAAAVRRGALADGRYDSLVGHFGTYGGLTTGGLTAALRELPALAPSARVLLIGRSSQEFARGFVAAHPEHADRVVATGGGDRTETAERIAACDVLIQPLGVGVATRNASVLAALALGRAVATTTGPVTEPLWRAEGIAALAPAGDARALASVAADLLKDPAARAAVGARAAAYYHRRFAFDRTVEALRADAP
jgi:glycosyltransferase involved in cell wall biosynthesis